MAVTASDVLEAFEELSSADQQQVAVEILRRSMGSSDIPELALDELAAELFRSYET